MVYYCYLLINSEKSTYIGVTNDLEKRLQQHNGILKGGGKATRMSKSPYKYHTILQGFESYGNALSFEWYWKHKLNRNNKWVRNGPGIDNKMDRLKILLNTEEWKHIEIMSD